MWYYYTDIVPVKCQYPLSIKVQQAATADDGLMWSWRGSQSPNQLLLFCGKHVQLLWVLMLCTKFQRKMTVGYFTVDPNSGATTNEGDEGCKKPTLLDGRIGCCSAHQWWRRCVRCWYKCCDSMTPIVYYRVWKRPLLFGGRRFVGFEGFEPVLSLLPLLDGHWWWYCCLIDEIDDF